MNDVKRMTEVLGLNDTILSAIIIIVIVIIIITIICSAPTHNGRRCVP